jgi:hypothetical protein
MVNLTRCLLTLIVVIQFSLLGWHASRSSPVYDEYGLFYAGIAYWRDGETTIRCVNPPLIGPLGTVFTNWGWPELDHFEPVYQSDPLGFTDSSDQPWSVSRPAHPFGKQLFSLYPKTFQTRLFFGRLLVSLFAVAGAIMLFLWGSRLYGQTAGLLAACFWAFQPQVLSHGSLITNDIPAASMMLICCFMFCGWISRGTWRSAVVGGVTLGICTLCKFTALLLWPIFLGFTVWRLVSELSLTRLTQAVLAVIVTVLVIGIPYRFVGVGSSIGEIEFQTDPQGAPPRYQEHWFASIPNPFPKDFVLGIDRQQFDFDRGMTGFVAGEISRRGRWWFYLYSMLVKLPTGTLIAIAASLAWALIRLFDRNRSWNVNFQHCLIACVAISIIEITAYKNGFASQHRYIFPLYPFLFLLIVAPLSQRIVGSTRMVQWTVKTGCVMTVIAALWVAPHWLGAFNVVSGGTARGHWHLFNDATDWGQDCYFVADWVRSHPQYRPMKWVRKRALGGIDQEAFGFPPDMHVPDPPAREWVIVSKSRLSIAEQSIHPTLRAQLSGEPVEIIGSTHLLYRVQP